MRYFQAIAGMVAGLCAGVVTGIMFLVMTVPQVDGSVPLLAMVARSVGSTDPAVGWSYHLFNSAVVGILFGAIWGKHVTRLVTAAVSGLITGFIWWVLGSLVMLPVLQGLVAMAPLSDPVLHPFAVGTLIGSLVFGVLMAVVFLWLFRPVYVQEYKEVDRQLQQKPSKRVSVGAGNRSRQP